MEWGQGEKEKDERSKINTFHLRSPLVRSDVYLIFLHFRPRTKGQPNGHNVLLTTIYQCFGEKWTRFRFHFVRRRDDDFILLFIAEWCGTKKAKESVRALAANIEKDNDSSQENENLKKEKIEKKNDEVKTENENKMHRHGKSWKRKKDIIIAAG